MDYWRRYLGAFKWIEVQDPFTIAKYTKKHNLLEEARWKNHKRFVDKDSRFIKMLQQIYAAKASNKHKIKFGLEVPRNYKDAKNLIDLMTIHF